MSDSQGIAITSVIIIPRNKSFCRYIINEGVPHTMRYYEMEKMLIELVPQHSQRIQELIRTFQNFMIVVPTQEVHQFKFDFDGEKEKLLTSLRQSLATKIPQVQKPNKSLSATVDGIVDRNMHIMDGKKISEDD